MSSKGFFSMLVFSLFITLLAGCSFPIQPDSPPSQPVTSEEVLPAAPIQTETVEEIPADISGSWSGTLTETSGTERQLSMDITLTETNTFTGSLVITSGDMVETYTLSGSLAGSDFQFADPDGRSYWGSIIGDTLVGEVAWDCFECGSWGQIALTRGASAIGSIEFVDLTDGAEVTLMESLLGPEVETRVSATEVVFQGRIILQVDGMEMDLERNMEEADPFETTLTWWPWHGNGTYQLEISSWPFDACCQQAVAAITVNVTDFPEDSETIEELFVRTYQEIFNLNLPFPIIARYVMPWWDAYDVSRWVSAAYIDEMEYEIQLMDDGTIQSSTRPIASYIENWAPICNPAGIHDFFVAFVDYGNTGITEEQAMDVLAVGVAEYNEQWAEISRAQGLAEPILQISAQGAFIDAPPIPGEFLEIAQIESLTGVETSGFDLVVEVDLDADMTVVADLGGLGFGGSGCWWDGSPTSDIYFVVSEADYLQGFPMAVFDHEFAHSLGWNHWWPNADSSVALQFSTDDDHNGFFPWRLFGWVDSDGDGIPEILDPTPYGMNP